MQLAPLVEVVPDLLYEGLNLLAARPKTGKSWLALNLANAVASGGTALGKIDVQAAPVLYLCLEDGKRRLQRRLTALLAKQHHSIPTDIQFATEWPLSSAGGLVALDTWLLLNPAARLVVIDTASAFEHGTTAAGNIVANDYAASKKLHDLAVNHHVAILTICHTRKQPLSGSPDFLDEIGRTTGYTAAADAILVLSKKRHDNKATLAVTGRDIEEESKLTLQWDPAHLHWELVEDDQAPAQEAPGQDAAVHLLAKGPASIKQIAQALGKDDPKGRDAVRQLIQRMKKNGKVHKVEGTDTYKLA
jgi:RecA-family ATPase